jgi:hypothetical protein
MGVEPIVCRPVEEHDERGHLTVGDVTFDESPTAAALLAQPLQPVEVNSPETSPPSGRQALTCAKGEKKGKQFHFISFPINRVGGLPATPGLEDHSLYKRGAPKHPPAACKAYLTTAICLLATMPSLVTRRTK